MRCAFLVLLISVCTVSGSAVACEGSLIKLTYKYSETEKATADGITRTVERTFEGCVDPELKKSVLDSMDAMTAALTSTSLVMRDHSGRIVSTGADAVGTLKGYSVKVATWAWQSVVPSAQATTVNEGNKRPNNVRGKSGHDL